MTTPAEPEIALDSEKDVEQQDSIKNLPDVLQTFPSAFYDPTTRKLLNDPVVNVSGDSYERKKLNGNMNTEDDDYPNRALKSIIEAEIKLSDTSLSGSLRRMDQRMWSAVGTFLESSPGMRKVVRPLPKSFYCPITQEIMTDPAIAKDGATYERQAIRQWIERNGSSPLTREKLTLNDIRDNNAIYELIQAAKGEDTPHESIRRWIDSGTATSRRSDRQVAEETEGSCIDCLLLPVYIILLILIGIVYALFFLIGAILLVPIECCCPGEDDDLQSSTV